MMMLSNGSILNPSTSPSGARIFQRSLYSTGAAQISADKGLIFKSPEESPPGPIFFLKRSRQNQNLRLCQGSKLSAKLGSPTVASAAKGRSSREAISSGAQSKILTLSASPFSSAKRRSADLI